VPADPTKVQGPLATDVGSRSPFERPKRVSLGDRRTSSLTPLQDLDGIITPADLHFERHHGGVPAIDPKQYSLLIHGMVDRPMVFTLADLKRFPGKSVIRFVECSGNGGRAYRKEQFAPDLTPQQIDSVAVAFRDAFMQGFRPALLFAGSVLLIAAVVSNRLIPGRETIDEHHATADAAEAEPVPAH